MIRMPVYESVNPEAKYFVLRYDKDPNALIAMLIYAMAVSHDNPILCDELLTELKGVAQANIPFFGAIASRLTDLEMMALFQVLF